MSSLRFVIGSLPGVVTAANLIVCSCILMQMLKACGAGELIIYLQKSSLAVNVLINLHLLSSFTSVSEIFKTFFIQYTSLLCYLDTRFTPVDLSQVTICILLSMPGIKHSLSSLEENARSFS